MNIAIGSDQHGTILKELIKKKFNDVNFIDMGAHGGEAVNYPSIGEAVARKVASGECDRGILICGTGIGMAITANKVKGCYAAVCHDVYSTERSVLSNNANVMCMGALVIGVKTAESLVELWLKLAFDPKSHSMKNVEMIRQLEA